LPHESADDDSGTGRAALKSKRHPDEADEREMAKLRDELGVRPCVGAWVFPGSGDAA
jgi:hypothetical protein